MKPLLEASLLILLDAKLRLGLQCVFELMNCEQSMVVRWNNEYSDSFGVSNGVKQGGVSCPILFCIIFIDNLLMALKKNDIGSHVRRIPLSVGGL